MPHSLPLVIDLYYYWASPRNGIVLPEDREIIRHLIHQLAQEQFRSGEELIRVTDPELPYDIYQLVFPPNDPDEPVSQYRGVQHWHWLGPMLLDALGREPHLFAMKIGGLIAARSDTEFRTGPTFRLDPDLLSGFFGQSGAEVIRQLTQERDRSEGQDRDFLDQIVRSAAAQQSGASQTGSPTE